MMRGTIATKHTRIVAVAFIALVPVISHLLFSWMGFTPTDEGFTLSLSRRILDGQFPHRDFIIIRPFLSPLIHVPFVLLGGQYTFWLSRLSVWFEFAVISWLWVSIIDRSMNSPFSLVERTLVALIAFAATVHTKHVTAWFTIDGLFLVSIGFALITGKKQTARLAGYFFLGLALLCKQSFVVVAPLALLIMGDWRRLRYWIAATLPGLLYLVYLISARTLTEAFIQLTSPSGLAWIAAERYRDSWILVSTVVGYVAARFSIGRLALPAKMRSKIVWLVFLAMPLGVAAVSLSRGTWLGTSFLVFGLLLGLTIHLVTSGAGLKHETRTMGLVLLSTFSVSLSGGYTSPALASGPILAVLVGMVFQRFKIELGRSLTYALVIASLAIPTGFAIGRVRYIYRDRPAAQLNKPVGEVLRGGRMIYTNPNTYAFMRDLNRAIEIAQSKHKEFTILPDVAAYWVTAPQQNHLPAVWPVELTTALMSRFVQAMESQRNKTIFIVQKVEADSLANGFTPLGGKDDYEVVRYAREHFVKIADTDFFELYQ
jgi:hypothetical protein